MGRPARNKYKLTIQRVARSQSSGITIQRVAQSHLSGITIQRVALRKTLFLSHVTTGSLVRQCRWFDRERWEPGGSGEGLECRSLEPHNMVHPGPNSRSSPSSHQDLIGEHLFAARRSRSAGRHLGWKPGANTSWQLS